MALPVVAIVGRPNVGKSTFFNRLLGRPEAIVAPVAGTTRDRIIGQVTWQDHPFILVDTGGLEPSPQDPLRAQVKVQVEMAVEEADLILFLTDGAEGVKPADEEIANWLRRTHKPVVLAVNKCDNEARELAASEFYALGLGDPMPISAYHNLGIYDLMDRVLALLPPPTPEEHAQQGVLSIAIVGRPNVGKSALLNAILGEPRAIVSELPGTTRDALDTPFEYEGRPVLLIDTAGIRRRGRVQVGIEKYSVMRAVRAVQRAEVTFMVIDAREPTAAQDAHILGLAYELYKGVVLVVNKWDLAAEHGLTQEGVQTRLRQHFHFMPYAPIVFTSALQGQGISELMHTAMEVFRERGRWVHHRDLHRAVLELMGAHPPPSQGRKRLRVHRVLQGGVNPPTVVLYVNHPDLIHFSYERYLENRLRETFGFRYTHLQLIFKRQADDRKGRV